MAEKQEFELLSTTRDKNTFYDHYCLCKPFPLERVVLLPGETDRAKWATFEEIHEMIRAGEICSVIAGQFLQEESALLARQAAQ